MLCSFFEFVSPLFFNSEFLSLFQPCLLFVVFFLNPFFCYFVRFRFVVSEFSQHIQCLSLQPAHVGTCSHRIVRIEQKFKFFKKKNEQEYRKTPSTIDQILYLSQKNANECSFHFIYCNPKQNSFCPFSIFLFYISLLLLSSWKSTGNLCSPHLKTELILLFRTRTIFSAI